LEGVAVNVTDWPLSMVGTLGETLAVSLGLTVNSWAGEYAFTWTLTLSVTLAQ
jgi:hypothetical protein